jgi:hypothetical protein
MNKIRLIKFNFFSPSFFWYIFLFDSITPLLLILNNIGYPVLAYFKIFSVSYLLAAILVTIKFGFRFNKISLLFLIFGIWFIFFGIINNDIKMKFVISSFFGIINPIFMLNYARVYMRSYSVSEITNIHMKFVFKYYIPITIFLYFSYYFFHYGKGSYSYYGFQTNWQYASLFLIYNKNISLALLGLILVILAGKRATIITTLIPFLAYYLSFKNFSLKNFIKTIITVMIIIAIIYVAFQQGYLRRFESTFSMNLNDESSLSEGSGGRSNEVFEAFRYLNNDPLMLFFGTGLGATYITEGADYTSEKNYIHFSPAHFVFQFGLIFTILLYSFFLTYTIQGLKKNPKNIFYNYFLLVVIGSFFGPNLLADPKTWFFIGLNYYNK